MKRRQTIVVLLIVVLAALMAYSSRDAIQRAILLPLSYLGWTLGVYYHYLPQFFLWGLMILLVVFAAIWNLIPRRVGAFQRDTKPRAERGQIEETARWIKKSEGGIYYKWLVAHRLGKTARELLAQREGRPAAKSFGALTGADWHPPADIETYLDRGANGSFAEFPQARWFWSRREPTPLDLNPRIVIEFLESQTTDAAHKRGIRLTRI